MQRVKKSAAARTKTLQDATQTDRQTDIMDRNRAN